MPSSLIRISHLRKYTLIAIGISLVLGFIVALFSYNNDLYLYSYFNRFIILKTIKYSSYFFIPNFATWIIVYFSLDFYKQGNYADRIPLLSKAIFYIFMISILASFIYLCFFPIISQKLLDYKRNSLIAKECLKEVEINYNNRNYQDALNALNIYMQIDKSRNARFNITRGENPTIKVVPVKIPFYKKKKAEEVALNAGNIYAEIEYAIKSKKKEKGQKVPNSIEYFAEKKRAYEIYSKGINYNDSDALLASYKIFKKLENFDWTDVEVNNKINTIEKRLQQNTFFLDELLGFDKFPIAENLVFYNINTEQKTQKIEIGKLTIIKNNFIMTDIKITNSINGKIESILYSKYGKLIKDKIYFTAIDRKKIDSVNSVIIEKPGEKNQTVDSLNMSIDLLISPKVILSLQENNVDLSNFSFNNLFGSIKYIKTDKNFLLDFYKEIFMRLSFVMIIFIYHFLAMLIGLRMAPRKLNINISINKLYTPFIFVFATFIALSITVLTRILTNFLLIILPIYVSASIAIAFYVSLLLIFFTFSIITIRRRSY